MSLVSPAPIASVEALRARIGWLCQILRLTAAAYALWVFALLALHWSDGSDIARAYGHWLRTDLHEIPAVQRVGGFLIQMVPWGLTVGACVNLWLLFSGFLAGRVFTVDAALTLRRLSLFGLAAVAIDMASRPILSMLMTIHLPPGSRHIGLFFQPNDLLNLMFLGGLLALGQVFKTAAEIAEDNAGIV